MENVLIPKQSKTVEKILQELEQVEKDNLIGESRLRELQQIQHEEIQAKDTNQVNRNEIIRQEKKIIQQIIKEDAQRLKREEFLKSQDIPFSIIESTMEFQTHPTMIVKSINLLSKPVLSEQLELNQQVAEKNKQKRNQSKMANSEVHNRNKKSEPKKIIEIEDGDWEAYVDINPDNQKIDPILSDAEVAAQAAAVEQQRKLIKAQEIQNKMKKLQFEAEKEQKKAKKSEILDKIHDGQKKKIKMVHNREELFRSPIVCILGDPNTGKTTLLDTLRKINVQGGSQQIGAIHFPNESLKALTQKCAEFYPVEAITPGLLVIDTPSRQSFTNLRLRGSSRCDLAILVVDLMFGIEQQTLEGIELLRKDKTPFVIALNKIDRMYNWKTYNMGSSFKSMSAQMKDAKNEFDIKYKQVIVQLAEKSIDAALYYDNPDPKIYYPIVPISGRTGEGLPDLLSVVVKYTSQYMQQRLLAKKHTFNCVVMEVKEIVGLGGTIDVILVDGTLQRGDMICLLSSKGPIKTKIQALLTRDPLFEIHAKPQYIRQEVIHGTIGVKICAPSLETAVAGSQLYLVNSPEEEKTAIDLVTSDFNSIKNTVKLEKLGVAVAASTLGSLEVFLDLLLQKKIPVSYISVGTVSKDDIMAAMKHVLADENSKWKKENACLLAFDVKILPDAQSFADENDVKIFSSSSFIYHIIDSYASYQKQCKISELLEDAVFPCIIKPVQYFTKSDPFILEATVMQGVLRPGTPICIFNHTKLRIGVVQEIESDFKIKHLARQETGNIVIKITSYENIVLERHFSKEDLLVSIISRPSIDALKFHYKNDLERRDWILIRDVLKGFFGIL